MIHYLHGAPNLALTLEADDMHIIKWWVDASFTVHPDMKSHTGGTHLGNGSVYYCTLLPLIIKSTQRVPPRLNSWLSMMWCPWSCGPDTYSRHKDMRFMRTRFFKTIKEPCYLKRMGSTLAVTECAILINICYFFVIDPIQLRKWPLNIAQLAKCWLTCLPSPYKVPPSIISVPLFWISQTMMRFVRPWCPWQATGVCGETSQQRMTTDRPASQSNWKEASRWQTWSNGWPRIM